MPARILLFLLVFSSLVSCKKFLNEKPDQSIAVPSAIAELQSLLDDPSRFNLYRNGSFMQAASDDYFLKTLNYEGLVPEHKQVYRFEPQVYKFPNDWSYAYENIFISNYCLDNIGNNTLTPTNRLQWNNVVGSALFYRSFCFLTLTLTYGKAYDESSSSTDKGISLRTSSDVTLPTTRASVGECFARIIEDAKLAATMLPDLPEHVFRPSKAAAYGLLARAYLNMRNYDSSLKYANLCLGIKSTLMNYNGDADLFSDVSATIPFRRFNKEVIFHSEMNGFIGFPPNHGFVDSNLYASYATNDLRKTAFFRANAGYFKFKGSYAQGQLVLFDGLATDELFLIRAECRGKTGDIAGAMSDLNQLLIRRWRSSVPYIPKTASTIAEAVTLVRTERRKELLMRGLRFSDIKRYNKEDSAIVQRRLIGTETITLQPNSSYYALPLPDDIVRITGIPQN